jgi:hypothetical protein
MVGELMGPFYLEGGCTVMGVGEEGVGRGWKVVL